MEFYAVYSLLCLLSQLLQLLSKSDEFKNYNFNQTESTGTRHFPIFKFIFRHIQVFVFQFEKFWSVDVLLTQPRTCLALWTTLCHALELNDYEARSGIMTGKRVSPWDRGAVGLVL